MSKSVFKRDVAGKQIAYPLHAIMKLSPTEGDIGIEIECEGNHFRKGPQWGDGLPLPAGWMFHKDGSLRGQDNAEYVLKKPIKFEKVKDHIDRLWKMFEDDGTVLDESNRTSVHIHLNAQNFHMNRLCSFFALFFCLEEILTEWCGDHRVGNLFCLRAKDAPHLVKQIKNFIQSDGKWHFSDGIHYANANAHALEKFGSIEIRSLRGVANPELILQWIEVLERIYKLSAEFQDPRAICDEFSGGGAYSFLEWVLGPTLAYVKAGIDWDNQQISESLLAGIRLAQDLCYCREWSNLEMKDLRADPFGRPIHKVINQLSNYEQFLAEYPMYGLQPQPTSQTESLLSNAPSPNPAMTLQEAHEILANANTPPQWGSPIAVGDDGLLTPVDDEEETEEDDYFDPFNEDEDTF